MCGQHHTQATAHAALTTRCVCGGGKPCQYLHGAGCFAKGLAEDNTLKCPDQTKECSCTCGTTDATKPCQEHLLNSNFCFSTGGSQKVCPADTKHCQIYPAQTHVSKLAPPSPPPTPAPTPSDPSLGTCTSITEWGKWTPCSKACGGGTHSRSPKVAEPTGCAAPDQSDSCNAHACNPVNCDYEWPTEWGECSMNCGTGYRYKKPIVKVAARDGGTACPIPLRQPCNTNVCFEKHKSCACNPLRMNLVDPDAPPPSKHHVQCVRRNSIINVLHPPRNVFYTCAYSVVSFELMKE